VKPLKALKDNYVQVVALIYFMAVTLALLVSASVTLPFSMPAVICLVEHIACPST